MPFDNRKTGFVLATKVDLKEVGKKTGYRHYNPPSNGTDDNVYHLEGLDGDYVKDGEKALIFKTFKEANDSKGFLDVVFSARLTDAGDDVLYLIEERTM